MLKNAKMEGFPKSSKITFYFIDRLNVGAILKKRCYVTPIVLER